MRHNEAFVLGASAIIAGVLAFIAEQILELSPLSSSQFHAACARMATSAFLVISLSHTSTW